MTEPVVVYPELADIQRAFPHLDPRLLGHDIAYPAMLTFLPAGDPQAVLNVTSGVTVPPADCAGGSGPCLTLHFAMPSTVSATYPDGLAGPAEIRVTNGTTAAVIGPLSQPRPDTTCDKMAETVFKQFTVLPPPNAFKTLVDDPRRVLAALTAAVAR